MDRRRFLKRTLAAAAGTQLPWLAAQSAILSPSGAVDGDINAVTGDGNSITLSRTAVRELGESLRGDLLLPGH